MVVGDYNLTFQTSGSHRLHVSDREQFRSIMTLIGVDRLYTDYVLDYPVDDDTHGRHKMVLTVVLSNWSPKYLPGSQNHTLCKGWSLSKLIRKNIIQEDVSSKVIQKNSEHVRHTETFH